MFYKLWAFLTNQEIVWLKDSDSSLTKTFAKVTPFGLMAKRYWPHNVRNVLLLPDGTVEAGSYVKEWKYDGQRTPIEDN